MVPLFRPAVPARLPGLIALATGMALVLAAAIRFIAWNWPILPDEARFGLAGGGMLLCLLLDVAGVPGIVPKAFVPDSGCQSVPAPPLCHRKTARGFLIFELPHRYNFEAGQAQQCVLLTLPPLPTRITDKSYAE